MSNYHLKPRQFSVATIVIPIRARKTNEDSLKRLIRLIHVIPDLFEIIVVNDGSSPAARSALSEIIQKRAGSSIISLNTRWRRFSLSRSRNAGAKAASSPVVIFHDVDFIGSSIVYQKLSHLITQRDVASNPCNFFCIPVAFLNEQGTQRYIQDFDNQAKSNGWSFLNSNPELDLNVLHFVRGSSCIVLNKNHLLSIGGHDESYDGHGAEDFELLHRLAEQYPIKEKPIDYSINTGSGPILSYRGFRSYFALYGEIAHLESAVLVHLYHPKRKIFGYYQHRRNFAKLKRLMENA
jgi:predicted glycosyltransferase involved in capsule biosynthesis